MRLSKSALSSVRDAEVPDASYFTLPETVLQFGTGVLLRGLPDFFIDKANKRGYFNGRIVVVKSTGDDVSEFQQQDCLFTHRICGIENGETFSRDIVNASISRVLAAKPQWEEVLQCATNPDLGIVISNTTEVGLTYLEENILHEMPASFPGKLLAVLYRRFVYFTGDDTKGLIIIPTELIPRNGTVLKDVVLKLAIFNGLEERFTKWISKANHFCDSLVDRIVPGKMPAADKQELEKKLGCTDGLTIVSEPYGLWAIESNDASVKERLSFGRTDDGVVVTDDISRFRELKLRLLNGTHTFSSGLAVLQGYGTVGDAMKSPMYSSFIRPLMFNEIIPAITGEKITQQEAENFANMVLDRFRNPFIEHRWINITLQYSSKMAMRNLPLLLSYVSRFHKIPELMSRGFAAHILFMKCAAAPDGKYYGERKGESYLVSDDRASKYADAWAGSGARQAVSRILKDEDIWGQNLDGIEGFSEKVLVHMNELISSHESVS